MLDMFQAKRKKPRYVIVIQGVKDLPAGFSGAEQMHVPQSTQLMGNGGFGHCKSLCQCADAPLAFQQKSNDAYATGVAQGAEELSQLNGFEFGEFHNI